MCLSLLAAYVWYVCHMRNATEGVKNERDIVLRLLRLVPHLVGARKQSRALCDFRARESAVCGFVCACLTLRLCGDSAVSA